MEKKSSIKKAFINRRILVGSSFALLVLAVTSIIVGILGVHQKFQARSRGYDRGMMSSTRTAYSYPTSLDGSQFYPPQDALKSGELAITVESIENTQKQIAGIVEKNNGAVHETFIAHASDRIKNGSIVIQIPAEKFETTVSDLKNIASEIIQESTRQIPPMAAYPMMESAISNDEVQADESGSSESASLTERSEISASPRSMIYPQPAFVQDKAYIKIIFVEQNRKEKVISQGYQNMMPGSIVRSDYAGLGMKNNLWIVITIKVLLLFGLLGLLIFLMKRIFKNFRSIRKAEKMGEQKQTIRQMVKPRARIIKLAKKK